MSLGETPPVGRAEPELIAPPAQPVRPLQRLGRLALSRLRARAPAVQEIDIETTAATPRPRAGGVSGYGATLILFVILPALASIFYLVFLASDQYVAETKFALRSAQPFGASNSDGTPSDALQKGGSGGGANAFGLASIADQDAYVVADYIRSAAVLDALAPDLDVRAIFRRPEADFWARLPADASREELLDYWRGMVSASVDSMSGIVTVTVRAFRREDALALAQKLTTVSEDLANKLSARARADAMSRAEAEVRRTEAVVSKALADQRAFREERGLIDPSASATSTSTLLMNAMTDRIRLQSEYSAASRLMSPNAPTLTSLKTRLQVADQEIEKLKRQLTGARESGAVSAAIARYEELELQRQFGEKIYMMAQDALERARQNAERQAVYLTAFAPAFMPQEALYPRRLAYSLLLPLAFLIVWGIFAMIVASVRDHRI